MRIVDRKTFLAMPSGTLFSKYVPCVFENMQIKGDSLANDFLYQQIVDAIDCRDSGEFAALLDDSERDGTSIPMDFDCQGRDGCFDEDQLFAVWERADVNALIERLKGVVCLDDAATAEEEE